MKYAMNAGFLKRPPALVILLLLFAVSLAVYFPSIRGGFLLDDRVLIVDNEMIKDLTKLPRLFVTDAFWPNSAILGQVYMCYRPIPELSYAVDHFFWKLDASWYHLENIFLHALNALLVFFLFYSLFSNYPLAFLTAFIFCVHPVHAEVVNFISGRADILQGMFTLLTMILYLRYLKGKGQFSLAASLVSFILALITREAGFLVFVPLFIFFNGWKARLDRSSLAFQVFSYAAIVVIYAWLRLSFLVPVEMPPGSGFSPMLDILNFFNLSFAYLKLLVLPFPLYMMRAIQPVTSFFSPQAVRPLLFSVFLAVTFFLAVRRREKIVVFAMVWFFAGILYLVKFMYKFPGLVSTEEHWIYLPSLGPILILVYYLLKLKARQLGLLAAAGMMVFYGSLANINSWNWSDPVRFYQRQINLVHPDVSYFMRSGLIEALLSSGKQDEALKIAYDMASSYRAEWSYVTLGNILRDMGRYKEARKAYESALKIDYFCLGANLGLKRLEEKTGESSEDNFTRGLPPQEAKIVELIKTGRFQEAQVALEKILDTAPSPKYYTLAGIALSKISSYRGAIKCFRAAVELNPDYLSAWYNMAVAYEKLKDYKNSDEAFRQLRSREKAKQ